jgi:hypothetical protein
MDLVDRRAKFGRNFLWISIGKDGDDKELYDLFFLIRFKEKK